MRKIRRRLATLAVAAVTLTTVYAGQGRPVQAQWYVNVGSTALSSQAVQKLNKTIPLLNYIVVPSKLPAGYKEKAVSVTPETGVGGRPGISYQLDYSNTNGATIELRARAGNGWGGPGITPKFAAQTLVLGDVGVGTLNDGQSRPEVESDWVFLDGAVREPHIKYGISVVFSDSVSQAESTAFLKGLRVIK